MTTTAQAGAITAPAAGRRVTPTGRRTSTPNPQKDGA